jgi:hypothetical protein
MDPNSWPLVQTVAVASALAWASGIRLYATLFLVGGAAYLGYISLPGDLAVLANPIVLAASGLLLFFEFFADKIPGLDSLWDALHTFIRIPAGALLAAGATTGLSGEALSAVTLAAGLLGGTITAGTHFTKAGSRALINTSPEPVSNVAASFTEEAGHLGGLWLAFAYPWVFLLALLGFLGLCLWLLPALWRSMTRILGRLAAALGLSPRPLA